MCTMMFADPCAVIDVLCDVLPEAAINIVLDIDILDVMMIDTLADVVIASEFVMSMPYSVDLLVDVVIDALTDVEIIFVDTGTLDVVVSASCTVYVLADVVINLLTDIIFGVVTDIGTDVLADENTNVFAAVMIDLDFTKVTPGDKSMLFCRASFRGWPEAVLDCDRALQAWMPSYHVRSTSALPALPQFLNQEPPRPQQLVLPDFLIVPHLGHTELAMVVVAASV